MFTVCQCVGHCKGVCGLKMPSTIFISAEKKRIGVWCNVPFSQSTICFSAYQLFRPTVVLNIISLLLQTKLVLRILRLCGDSCKSLMVGPGDNLRNFSVSKLVQSELI